MKTRRATNRIKGLTLFEVLVVIAVIAVLAAILLPAVATARRKSSQIGCVNNIHVIVLAFRSWEGDNGDKYPMFVSVTNGGAMEYAEKGIAYRVFQVMSNELGNPNILICDQDTNRLAATDFSTDFNNLHLSYFVGMVTNETNPQMILSGDDNLAVNGVNVRPGILNLSTNSSVAWTKERHNGSGNIGLADGSVQQDTSYAFRTAILDAASPSRLVIP